MKEIGKAINLMEMDVIFILMGQNMKGNGKMINRMGRERKNGLMVVHILGNIKKEKNRVEEYLNGLMVIFMKEILIIMLLMEKENILLLIKGFMKEIG